MNIDELKDHIRKVVSYAWEDELADFAAFEGDAANHIFASLVALDNFVEGTEKSMLDHLEEAGYVPVESNGE